MTRRRRASRRSARRLRRCGAWSRPVRLCRSRSGSKRRPTPPSAEEACACITYRGPTPASARVSRRIGQRSTRDGLFALSCSVHSTVLLHGGHSRIGKRRRLFETVLGLPEADVQSSRPLRAKGRRPDSLEPFWNPAPLSDETRAGTGTFSAEREGFEPSVGVLPLHTLSRRAPSTTRSPLLSGGERIPCHASGRHTRQADGEHARIVHLREPLRGVPGNEVARHEERGRGVDACLPLAAA